MRILGTRDSGARRRLMLKEFCFGLALAGGRRRPRLASRPAPTSCCSAAASVWRLHAGLDVLGLAAAHVLDHRTLRMRSRPAVASSATSTPAPASVVLAADTNARPPAEPAFACSLRRSADPPPGDSAAGGDLLGDLDGLGWRPIPFEQASALPPPESASALSGAPSTPTPIAVARRGTALSPARRAGRPAGHLVGLGSAPAPPQRPRPPAAGHREQAGGNACRPLSSAATFSSGPARCRHRRRRDRR